MRQEVVNQVNQQLENGKKLVEEYLGRQDATEFYWSKDFDTLDETIEFNWEAAPYKVPISHQTLINLEGDSQRESKLRGLWEGKFKIQD